MQRLREHSEEGTLSQLQVYYWVNEVKLDRPCERYELGQGPDESLATITANKIEREARVEWL
jgi:hypothetical protein